MPLPLCLWLMAMFSLTIEPVSSPRPLGREEGLAEQIEQAHQRATCTMDRVFTGYQRRIVAAEDPIAAWNAHPRLRKWMGPLDPEQDQAVIASFGAFLQQMQQRLARREVAYVIEEDPKGRCERHFTNAYVHLADTSAIIYVCERWREQSPHQRVSTLVHELVHTFGYDHPQGVHTPLEALHLAKDSPALARQSPENFESMIEYYVCQE
jgi:hypothetical protein